LVGTTGAVAFLAAAESSRAGDLRASGVIGTENLAFGFEAQKLRRIPRPVEGLFHGLSSHRCKTSPIDAMLIEGAGRALSICLRKSVEAAF
jgi:hypothetical protein